MFRKVLTLVATTLLLGAGGLHAEEKNNWTSPDGALIAHTENRKTNGSADYTDWDVVTIRDRNGKVLASLSLEEGSGVSLAVVDDAL